MNHPTRTFRTENTIATTIAAPMLRTRTDGRKRASSRTVAVNRTRCSSNPGMNMGASLAQGRTGNRRPDFARREVR